MDTLISCFTIFAWTLPKLNWSIVINNLWEYSAASVWSLLEWFQLCDRCHPTGFAVLVLVPPLLILEQASNCPKLGHMLYQNIIRYSQRDIKNLIYLQLFKHGIQQSKYLVFLSKSNTFLVSFNHWISSSGIRLVRGRIVAYGCSKSLAGGWWVLVIAVDECVTIIGYLRNGQCGI